MNNIKQKIVKINEDIAVDFNYSSNKNKDSKSVVIQSKMKEFIGFVKNGAIKKQPIKKAIGVTIPDELFQEFKKHCKKVNYGVGEALDMLIEQYNDKTEERLKTEKKK